EQRQVEPAGHDDERRGQEVLRLRVHHGRAAPLSDDLARHAVDRGDRSGDAADRVHGDVPLDHAGVLGDAVGVEVGERARRERVVHEHRVEDRRQAGAPGAGVGQIEAPPRQGGAGEEKRSGRESDHHWDYHLEHGHGEERPKVVVRDAQPRGEQPYHRPEDLVRDVAVEVEQQLEVGPGDREQGTGGVRDGVGGALGAVEDRHFTEAGPGLEDGQRLLARPRDGARDPDLAFRDDEQAVAGLAFLEDVLPDGEFLLPVAARGALRRMESLGVLARDIVAGLGSLGGWVLRRPLALPARAGGKAVTALQLLTLVAVVADSPYARRLAWATAAVGLYAI